MDITQFTSRLKAYLHTLHEEVRFDIIWRHIHDLAFVNNPPSVDAIRVICIYALLLSEEKTEELLEVYSSNLDK